MLQPRQGHSHAPRRRSSGATALQYVLLVAGIAAVVVAAIVIFRGYLTGLAGVESS